MKTKKKKRNIILGLSREQQNKNRQNGGLKMKLTGKLNAGMVNFAKNMKTGVDNYKVDGKIAEQESRIKALRKEIANLVMVRLDAGDEMSPEIMERYAAIVEAREVIA